MIHMNKLFLSRTATKTVIISRSVIEFGCKIILAISACHDVRVKIIGLNYYKYIDSKLQRIAYKVHWEHQNNGEFSSSYVARLFQNYEDIHVSKCLSKKRIALS